MGAPTTPLYTTSPLSSPLINRNQALNHLNGGGSPRGRGRGSHAVAMALVRCRGSECKGDLGPQGVPNPRPQEPNKSTLGRKVHRVFSSGEYPKLPILKPNPKALAQTLGPLILHPIITLYSRSITNLKTPVPKPCTLKSCITPIASLRWAYRSEPFGTALGTRASSEDDKGQVGREGLSAVLASLLLSCLAWGLRDLGV